MFKVDDKVFFTRGTHQNETGMITAIDDWSGELTVTIDGWPGSYTTNPDACIISLQEEDSVRLEEILGKLDDLLDGMPTWTN
jgi:ribosomal protein S4E|tara:strand:- start:1430 stop:1675 length:246 start_codon:yes stop_codon:yes gene_type:complete